MNARIWISVSLGLAMLTACGHATSPTVKGPHAQEIVSLIEAVDRDNRALVNRKLVGVEYVVEKSDKSVTKRIANAGDVPTSKSKYCMLANVEGFRSAETSDVIVWTQWKCQCCDIFGPDRFFEFESGRLRTIRTLDLGLL